jgi:PKD repeat protein
MKKNLALFALLMVAALFTNAQTMSVHVLGTILRDSTNLPVSNHEVVIQADSNAYNFQFTATRFTSQTGLYDCTINNVPTTGAPVTFSVRTQNCDSTWIYKHFTGTVNYDTVNFTICNGNTPPCQAGFTYFVDTASPHQEVHFQDQSTPVGNIISWHWAFGDGTDITIVAPGNPNVSHVYAVFGTYTTCLTISTSTGCTSYICHEITVGGNTECHANYTYYADSLNALHVHFQDISTPLNMITSRLWNFGDPGSGSNNTATTGDPWHTFTHAGPYAVCLTIHTTTGCESTFCDSIMVGSNTTNCENWITYTSSGLTFSFEGHTHSIYPTSYSWNFGDPNSGLNVSNEKNPTHIFSAAGNYVITLHTIDSTGCEWNRSQEIYVHTATYDVYGFVYLANQVYADHGIAELMRVDSGMITTIDSVMFGDSLGMYHFGGVPPGHYYVRATLIPASNYYGQYAPTYYHDAINWANATLIELGQPINPYNIYMHPVPGYNSGNGNINGTITQGGKYNGNGLAATNVEVLLMNASGGVLAYTMTNSIGEFTFPQMEMGTYKVYPEMVEKVTTPTTVILDAAHADANVIFTISGGFISGIHDNAVQAEFTLSDIYPNPVSDNANFTIQTLRSREITVGIYSITGEFVLSIPVSLHQGANKVTIPVSDLRKGMYYVKVEKPEGGMIVKKFILGR